MMLERDAHLATLDRVIEPPGSGRVVLVSGETGAGKSTLLRHFLRRCEGRIGAWMGLCDPARQGWSTAAAYDLASGLGDVLDPAAAPPRDATVFRVLLDELARRPQPRVLVMEDVHWADDVTLDFLVLLGRRLDRLSVVLVLSYRDDELGSLHPLYHALAQVPSDRLTPVALPPLSLGAVAVLAEAAGRDAREVYALSGGNPLLTTELLATDVGRVPPRIHALTCARLARLSPAGREFVGLVAAGAGGVEPALLHDLAAAAPAVLDQCLVSGLLALRDGRVGFRHELVRLAAREALGPVVLGRAGGRAAPCGSAGRDEVAALSDLAVRHTVSRDRPRAMENIGRAIRLTDEHGRVDEGHRLAAVRAQVQLNHGDWAQAEAGAAAVIGRRIALDDPAAVLARCVLGTIMARRGHPSDTPAEARWIGSSADRGLHHQVAVAVTAAERHWWCDGTVDPAALAVVQRTFDLAWSARHPWHAGELAWWLSRAGVTAPVARWYAEPYRLMLRRRWKQAADAWAGLGCPFEEAESLSGVGDPSSSRRALDLYDRLGATIAATRLRSRLRLTRHRSPREPHQTALLTRHHLTARQLEVVGHVATGMSNAEIAAELGISVRTVDHHVAAVLAKLSVGSRREIRAAAGYLGIGNSVVRFQPSPR